MHSISGPKSNHETLRNRIWVTQSWEIGGLEISRWNAHRKALSTGAALPQTWRGPLADCQKKNRRHNRI